MVDTIRESLFKPSIGPIPLICPCGKPLELAKMSFTGPEAREKWVFGHYDCTQSPLIHGGSFQEVMGLLLVILLKHGHFPNREEYMAETNPKMLAYDQSDSAFYNERTKGE